jgi:hypothetical protein
MQPELFALSLTSPRLGLHGQPVWNGEIPVDGCCTQPENAQATYDRTVDPECRQKLQQGDEERAPEKHRYGIELAAHQEGLASRQHVANQAAADGRNDTQDNRSEWPAERQRPDLVRRFDRKQRNADTVKIQYRSVNMFAGEEILRYKHRQARAEADPDVVQIDGPEDRHIQDHISDGAAANRRDDAEDGGTPQISPFRDHGEHSTYREGDGSDYADPVNR